GCLHPHSRCCAGDLEFAVRQCSESQRVSWRLAALVARQRPAPARVNSLSPINSGHPCTPLLIATTSHSDATPIVLSSLGQRIVHFPPPPSDTHQHNDDTNPGDQL